MMRKLVILVLLLVIGVIPALAQESVAYLRVAHFAVDAGPVDIYVNGEAMVKDLAFPDVTQWMEVAPGTYSVAVAPAGTSIDEAIIGPADFDLAADGWVTIAAMGLKGNKTLMAQAIVEDFSEMRQGEARVSMFHAISNLDPINFLAGDTMLVEQLGFPGFFEEGDGFATADIVAQTYDFSIQDAAGETLVDVGNLLLGANRNYFIAAVGVKTNPQYVVVTSDLEELMAAPEVEETPVDVGTGKLYMRVGHLAVGAPPVDVYVNGALSDVQALTYPGLSPWVQLDAGVYDIAIAPAGTSIDEALLRQDVPLATGTAVTLAAIGSLDKDTFAIQPILEDFSETAPAMARISVFHAIPNGGLVNLVANDTVLIQGLGYPGFFEGEGDGYSSVDVVAKDYALKITLEDGTELFDLGSLKLGDGRSYFIALAGLAEDPLYIIERTDIADLSE